MRLTEALLWRVIRLKHSFAIENASGTYVFRCCVVRFFPKIPILSAQTAKIFTINYGKSFIVLKSIEEQYRYSEFWPMNSDLNWNQILKPIVCVNIFFVVH